MSTADVDPGAELGALGLHLARRRSIQALLHLELGDAVAQQPADPVGALEAPPPCVPARVSCWAAARPAGPEPMTATFLPVRSVGQPAA
jgi:hypothetical protein